MKPEPEHARVIPTSLTILTQLWRIGEVRVFDCSGQLQHKLPLQQTVVMRQIYPCQVGTMSVKFNCC